MKEVEVEGNEKLQRFIQLLSELNQQTVELLRTGNTEQLLSLNKTIEEMYSIQHGNKAAELRREKDYGICNWRNLFEYARRKHS